MDAFSCLLDSNNDMEGFKPIVCNDLHISHLLYTDDVLVFFGEASLNNCTSLNEIMDTFAKSSGLQVNHGKSSLILHRNSLIANDICASLGIPTFSYKVTNLGLPIFIKRAHLSDFSPLLDVISNKLSGWKAKSLYFAGRFQFFKFTIWNTIAYWIRGAIIPKTCYKQLNKLCSRFLFSGDINVKKMHLISWVKTCKPRTKWGLGLPTFDALRFAFDCSLICRIYNYPSLLSHWLFNTYCSPWKLVTRDVSPMWKSITGTIFKAKNNFCFTTMANCNISLYWDP
ncbi:uncharacterized protein LOC110093034 [Dendrobium catenatum]|uniref:uncharacterized protein LOC110093034 n=1 Tax=Dendrobium catenatum TaxID=906689 RepID=UPI0009F26194|nr:uncharacterized protein LOC110093034 [Dendrobium catenatum]